MSTTQGIEQLLGHEISRIAEQGLVNHIRTLLIPVGRTDAAWGYGEGDLRYPCWMVAFDAGSNRLIVYSEHGFGPAYPWGVLDRTPTLSMGSDDMWYLSLEDAVRASGIWKGTSPIGYEVG